MTVSLHQITELTPSNKLCGVVVVNCASGFATGAAEALILGLGDRKRNAGKDVFILHVRGFSMPIFSCAHINFADIGNKLHQRQAHNSITQSEPRIQ
jgi:hypothetical protein